MEGFFEARSVAVVGVSANPGNLAQAIVYNLLQFWFQGLVYLVGPHGGSFAGHKIYPRVRELPEPVDLAAILVPASAVPEVLRDCGEKGIKRAVLMSGGFRELGDERRALEEEVVGILGAYGIRMIGPNCLGIMNRRSGLAVPFMTFQATMPVGGVAVVSQSGGVAAMMVNCLEAENLGFSKFASIGNKLDVNEVDLLEYLVRDEETRIVFCYLEGIADGRRFMELASGSSKPVVLHKSNRGRAGSVIARSHSASLSADDRVLDAALRQSGVLRVFDQREAMTAIKGLVLPPMRGNRLAVVSRSGGHAVMAADAADDLGFELPPFPESLLRTVQERSRARVIRFHNPLDLGDLFDMPLYHAVADETLARDDIDGLLFIHNYQGVFEQEASRQVIAGLGSLIEKHRKPLAVCVFTTKPELDRTREKSHFPIFTDPREALLALAGNREHHRERPAPFSHVRPPDVFPDRVKTLLDGLPEGPIGAGVLGEILSAYGLFPVPWRQADSMEDALAAARDLGYPVVLKTARPEVIHKSEVRGVRLNLADEPSVREAYEDLRRRLGPRVLVQETAAPGVEWFLGGRQDPNFGPVLVTGLGGIYVEVFRETALRVGPVSSAQADRMLDECKASAILGGIRGRDPLDRRALVDMAVRASWLLHDFPEIRELDLNPVGVFPDGCRALDWRAVKGPVP